MMRILVFALFIVTALDVIDYDYAKQEIPLLLVVLNFASLAVFVENYFLLVLLFHLIILCAMDCPIDIIYIIAMCVIGVTTIPTNPICIFGILPVFMQTVTSNRLNKEKISLLVSIEIGLIFMTSVMLLA